jgi:putative phosphotransacetylase
MMKKIPIGVSARHIHLSQKHMELLFGIGYQLNIFKLLSQPDQFAAKETVCIIGSKGRFENVRILGPARGQTQLEIARTDAFFLGIDPPVRESGHIEGTPGITIVGPSGQMHLDQGVIIAARHIHLHTSDAMEWGVSDKQRLRIRVGGQRGLVFEEVIARVSDQFKLEMHVDTDEANAAGIQTGDLGELLE